MHILALLSRSTRTKKEKPEIAPPPYCKRIGAATKKFHDDARTLSLLLVGLLILKNEICQLAAHVGMLVHTIVPLLISNESACSSLRDRREEEEVMGIYANYSPLSKQPKD
jgi:hypothetical protein